MNSKFNTLRFVAPVFLLGVTLTAISSKSLEQKGLFQFEPNPGALAKSPFGRTIGMALQGPITRFWDRGVGDIEGGVDLEKADRPDEKLFNFVSGMRDAKADLATPDRLGEEYQDYAMARIEKKLSLAWKMDPRNFANYAIYQMFLWEGFNSEVIDTEMSVRDLSLSTLETSLEDKGSPVSLLTAGQAAYDLVFAARTSKEQSRDEAFQDIDTFSSLLPEIISDYDQVVASMRNDGRWERISEAKKLELNERKLYLEHLNQETRSVVDQLSNSSKPKKGERTS